MGIITIDLMSRFYLFWRQIKYHSFMFKQFWYKASMTGGGESSIQYNSSTMFLVYWAKICATLFPFLLIQLIEVECNPRILHLMPSYTCPSNERSPEELATAFMTVALSVSIIIFVKPDSTTNSRAFRQANASASSLQLIDGPLTDIAAITSPTEFQIIAPKPKHWIPSNTAV